MNTLPRPVGHIEGDSFVLDEPLVVPLPGLPRLHLRPGFKGESSIPRFAWSILGLTPTSEHCLVAGLVHDWFYRTHRTSREQADDLHFMLCILAGCSHRKASTMYRILRACGWLAWKRVSRKDRLNAERLGELEDACRCESSFKTRT